jgi:lysozyme family protein
VKENFDECLSMLLKHEGGYVNHPRDPGGETNLGVTRKVWEEWIGKPAGKDAMKALTVKDVAPLYKKLYWDKVKGDDLPSGVDWAVFDWAVNSGTGRAAKALQRIVGVEPDGGIGAATLAAVEKMDDKRIIEAMAAAREKFYRGLSTFDTFGKGWLRRNQETLEVALTMVGKKTVIGKIASSLGF